MFEPELLAIEIMVQELDLSVSALLSGLARLEKILEEVKQDESESD